MNGISSTSHNGVSHKENILLIYAVSTSPGHDNEGHFECERRMTSILDALAAHSLIPGKDPTEVGIARNTRFKSVQFLYNFTPTWQSITAASLPRYLQSDASRICRRLRSCKTSSQRASRTWNWCMLPSIFLTSRRRQLKRLPVLLQTLRYELSLLFTLNALMQFKYSSSWARGDSGIIARQLAVLICLHLSLSKTDLCGLPT